MDPMILVSSSSSDSDGSEEKSISDSSESETEAEEDNVYSWVDGSEEEETDEDSPVSAFGNRESSVDRISSLPDSLVQRILSSLPSTRQAVQSGILSNRWRNQWTRVTNLVFTPEFRSGSKYLRLIENTLILHDCSNLKKFHLEYDPQSKQDPQFFPKIHFALRKGVEELVLLCYCVEGSYMLPKFLLSNAFLVRLEMENCSFMPYWRVNWESLKSLKMDCLSVGGNGNWIGNVVSGSPLLKSLELCLGTLGDRDVAIVSKSLKVLILKDVEIPSDVKISCPNLVVLHVVAMDWCNSTFSDKMIRDVLSESLFLSSLKLVTYHGYDQLVIDSNSLKTLHLELIETKLVEISCPNLEKLDLIGLESEKFEVVNLPSSVSTTLHFLWCGEYLAQQILEQLQHVERITFDGCFTTMVSRMLVNGYMSLSILKSKSLTLKVGSCFASDIPGIAYALRSPNLEKLVIELKSHQFYHEAGMTGANWVIG